MNRRTFFFLGLGLMGGKWMYRDNLFTKPFEIYKPTQKQIDWLRNGQWQLYQGGRGYGKQSMLERQIADVVRNAKPGEKLVIEKMTFGTIIIRHKG